MSALTERPPVAALGPPPAGQPSWPALLARRWPVLLVAAVVAVDQAVKAAAGHGALPGGVVVNSGASSLWPDLLPDVWRPVAVGAVADLLGALVLVGGLLVAARLRGPARVGILLVLAGLLSNALDRWGLSYLTYPAPHPRGAVDLEALDRANLADLAVVMGGLVLAGVALTAAVLAARARWSRGRGGMAVVAVVAALAGLWGGLVARQGEAGALEAAQRRAEAAERRLALSQAQVGEVQTATRQEAASLRQHESRQTDATLLDSHADWLRATGAPARAAAPAALAGALRSGGQQPVPAGLRIVPRPGAQVDGEALVLDADGSLAWPPHRPNWAAALGAPPGACDVPRVVEGAACADRLRDRPGRVAAPAGGSS